MSEPLFFNPLPGQPCLEGAEAQHLHRVLRMREGAVIRLTDGRGGGQRAQLTRVSEKKVQYVVLESWQVPLPPLRVHMAVAPTRKAERNEWMMEKLVEIGVDKVSFIKTEHTHLESFNRVVNGERLERIAVAAMKQSERFYLPQLEIGKKFGDFLAGCKTQTRFVAYVPEKTLGVHLARLSVGVSDVCILIGPEGDFTGEEIHEAAARGFSAVSLGEARLRTETAAIAACHSVHLAQQFAAPVSAGFS